MLNENDINKLIDAALFARENAYCPYSGFAVGAALLCGKGAVVTGFNIENAAFTPTVCAERVVFFNALSSGHKEFSAVCVTGGKSTEAAGQVFPCGVCLQVMLEFCNPDTFTIITASSTYDYTIYKLKDLIPHGFSIVPSTRPFTEVL